MSTPDVLSSPAPRSALVRAMLAAFALGCAPDVDLPEGVFACASNAECPADWFCRADRRCWRTATGVDGGPRDGGQSDGGRPPIDGGPSDFPVRVVLAGTGGAVTSQPSGIDCGGTCDARFAAGTELRLTATGSATAAFVRWGGACTGSANPCTVTLDRAIEVTAEFGPCGGYGERCCESASPCAQGACLAGTCATFGGAFQTNAGACARGNPLNRGDCSCPLGFRETRVFNEPYRNTTDPPLPVTFCTAPNDAPGADYRGAFRSQNGSTPACMSPCLTNPIDGGCGCPAGANATVQTVNACFHAAGICTGGEALSFGGVYFEIDRSAGGNMSCGSTQFPDGCRENPQTTRCTCPVGFTEVRFESSARWSGSSSSALCSTFVGVCMKTP